MFSYTGLQLAGCFQHIFLMCLLFSVMILDVLRVIVLHRGDRRQALGPGDISRAVSLDLRCPELL